MSFRKLLDEAVDHQGYFIMKPYGARWQLLYRPPAKLGMRDWTIAEIDLRGTDYVHGVSSTDAGKSVMQRNFIDELENAIRGSEELRALLNARLADEAIPEPKIEESQEPSFKAKFDGKTSRNTHWDIFFDPALPTELTAFDPKHPEMGIKHWLDKKVVLSFRLDHDDIPEALHKEMVDVMVAALNKGGFSTELMGPYYTRLVPEPRVAE